MSNVQLCNSAIGYCPVLMNEQQTLYIEHTSNAMNKTKYHEMKIDEEEKNIKMC